MHFNCAVFVFDIPLASPAKMREWMVDPGGAQESVAFVFWMAFCSLFQSDFKYAYMPIITTWYYQRNHNHFKEEAERLSLFFQFRDPEACRANTCTFPSYRAGPSQGVMKVISLPVQDVRDLRIFLGRFHADLKRACSQ